MKNTAIILCSGGIDSTVTANYVKEKIKPEKKIILFFDYEQKSLLLERKFSKKCAKDINAEFIEIKLDWLGKISNSLINKKGAIKTISKEDLINTKEESEKFYVPCRNTVFLSYALALAESISTKEKSEVEIFVGFKCEGKESYPDTTKEFVKQFNLLSKIGCNSKIKISAPLIFKDKEDIILLGKKLGVRFENTVSCYIGKKEQCGKCLACKLRRAGFYWAGIKDPTKYSKTN